MILFFDGALIALGNVRECFNTSVCALTDSKWLTLPARVLYSTDPSLLSIPLSFTFAYPAQITIHLPLPPSLGPAPSLVPSNSYLYPHPIDSTDPLPLRSPTPHRPHQNIPILQSETKVERDGLFLCGSVSDCRTWLKTFVCFERGLGLVLKRDEEIPCQVAEMAEKGRV